MISGLKSAGLKLARARKHLRAIKRRIARYSSTRPHKVTAKAQGKKKLNIPKPPPREISILAGEMVYQMRSALDHLVFDIIKRNPDVATVDRDWREHCKFPLRIEISKNRSTPLAKSEFLRSLPGISDRAFTIIERMQPYYGVGEVNNALRFLAHLSNIDKHRHLNLIRPRVRQHQHIKYRSGFESGGWQLFDRGTIIETSLGHGWDYADRPVHVKRSYETIVSFNEREHLGDATSLPIDYLLNLILYYIEIFVVPALRELIKNP